MRRPLHLPSTVFRLSSMSTPLRLKNSSQGPKTLVESAYRDLRRDIIEGHLTPGAKLRVEHLKDSYGVGAGTLREALSLLVADALVVSQGQRGFRVAPMSLTDFEDITRVRVMLECEALRQSIAHGDDAWEAELLAAFHRLTKAEEKRVAAAELDEWEERNRIFHEVLISACPSHWIKNFLALLYQQAERYRRLSLFLQPIPRDVHSEHESLLKSALARDAEHACTVLSEHIHLTFRSISAIPPETFDTPATR